MHLRAPWSLYDCKMVEPQHLHANSAVNLNPVVPRFYIIIASLKIVDILRAWDRGQSVRSGLYLSLTDWRLIHCTGVSAREARCHNRATTLVWRFKGHWTTFLFPENDIRECKSYGDKQKPGYIYISAIHDTYMPSPYFHLFVECRNGKIV